MVTCKTRGTTPPFLGCFDWLNDFHLLITMFIYIDKLHSRILYALESFLYTTWAMLLHSLCFRAAFAIRERSKSDPNREGPWRITSMPDLCSVHTGTQSEHKRHSIHKARWPVYIGQTIHLTTAFLTTIHQERCLLNTNLDYHPPLSFCRPYNYNVDLWRFYELLFMGWQVIDGC